MAKKLSDLIGPRAERKLVDGEKRFIDKHVVKDSKDRIGKDGKQGNDDKLFKASNVKVASRAPHHGFTAGEGEAVYESREQKLARIDELSKKTLGSYVSKASDSLAVSYKKKEDAHSDASKVYQMKHGRHGTDTDKHLDKASDSLNSLARKHGRTVSKRAHGIDKAVKKLTKEEKMAKIDSILNESREEKIQRIDELSKKTLGSYVKKAHAEAPALSDKIDRLSAKRHHSTGPFSHVYYDKKVKRAEKRETNRRDGVKKAVDKLTKEETLSTGSIFTEGFDHDKWCKYYDRAVTALKEVNDYLDGLKAYVDKAEGDHDSDYECYHDCYNIKSLASQIESVAEDVGKTLANKKADEKAMAKWRTRDKVVGY
jgi:hypothetical protein